MSITERLKALVKGPDGDLDLAEGALLIAKQTYPDLDVACYLDKIEQLATNVRAGLGKVSSTTDVICRLNHYLFTEEGFVGNRENYYDPRNAFLNDVLDRKLGVPITLSILYMEIGRRLGLPLKGVSFPGHFLVKMPTQSGEIVLDPFSGGIPLNAEDLRNQLTFAYGQQHWLGVSMERMLMPAGKREILVRMLRNLKSIYMQQENWSKALPLADTILAILPTHPLEVKDLAAIYEKLGYTKGALKNYQLYLQLLPSADDVREVRQRIDDLARCEICLH